MFAIKSFPIASPTSKDIVLRTSRSGVKLHHGSWGYELQMSVAGQRYVTERRELLLTLPELQHTLKGNVTVFRIDQSDQRERVAEYPLASEARELFIQGWLHACLKSRGNFQECIAKVTLVCIAGLGAVVYAGEASTALPIGFALAGALAAAYTYFSGAKESAIAAQMLTQVQAQDMVVERGERP